MDEFCGSEFWNNSVTWETDSPHFTRCFEQTVLVWIPCAFLWIFAALDVFYMRNSKDRNIPKGILNISKLILTALITILTICDLVYAITYKGETFPVNFYTPVIKIATFILAGVLVHFNRLYGMRVSGLLFIFWFLMTVFHIPRLLTEIRLNNNRVDSEDFDYQESFDSEHYNFVSFIIFFVLSCLILILNCFADSQPQDMKYPPSDKPCPEASASFLSRLFFHWFDSFVWLGYRRPLENKDLWSMNAEDTSAEVAPRFLKYWNQSVAKNSQVEPYNAVQSASFKKSSASINFTSGKAKKPSSILPALVKAFGATFLFGSVLKLVNDLLTFVSPQILKLLINFVSEDEPLWRGYLYAGLLFGVATTQTLFLAQYFHRMFLVGLRIRTALISAIFRKALVLSNVAKKETTVGEIVNLMAVDAQRFMDLVTYLNMIWSAPLQISLAIYFLWQILGPSVLAGLAVMIVLIPVNGVIANKAKNLQIKQMKNKDERVKMMNEILNGIKVLKLYAWEPSFEQQVLKIRDKEVHVLKQAAYLNAGTSFIWSCAPFMVALSTFATYVLVDDNNILDAKTAFTSLALFNILRFPLSMLPMLISNMVQTSVSVKRINKFMNGEELDPNNVQHDTSEKNPLLIENGTFSWGDENSTLKNINMQIESNKLVAIVGSVGSGKSSLISAFLGEMEKISGRVNTIGSIAYVPQQSWIQNATLKDNILFGRPFDKKRYEQIIEACALKPDLEILPGGDQTEIGEKGINLSGGQKQRVSLARAVYNNADIYFFDDPLSAVDSHVGKHIFDKVIGPEGILARKTRVLVTHGLTYLKKCDNIFVLKDGEISEQGTHQELLDKKGAFAEFLIQHLQEVNEDTENIDEIKAQLEGLVTDKELKAKFDRAISTTRSRSDSTSSGGSGKLSRQTSSNSETELRHRRASESPAKQADTSKQNGTQQQKLIESEKSETGSVKWEVYKHYLKSIGWWLAGATVVLNMIFQGFSIGSNIWLARWSNDDAAANDTGKRDMYLGGYAAFGLGQVFSQFVMSLIYSLGAIFAAQKLHTVLVKNLFRLPILFFDTTPLGRVLNRVSKDVDVLDNQLPHSSRMLVAMSFTVMATIAVISYSTPIFLVVIVPIAILYYFVQRFYVATSRQLKRLESVSRSPIYSHFGESISGTSTIRAYNVEPRFINESEEKVDFNQVCYFPSIIANRWLAVRLEIVGNLIILFAALFAVMGKNSLSPGLVGLSVSYALSVTQTLNWLVR
ncbi:hypothetical protein PVAND_004755 [Polypedilum vanderplanki]|uniref:ABC-type glutathione-S-conjugate transporter n=1 Tax=Polypedilum vanderplanki TaxID=319348 RepID=A0A9J6BY71_POLVA|nr:hypothetical protein PVAND_004755 [Polypedilum vanderplanki]